MLSTHSPFKRYSHESKASISIHLSVHRQSVIMQLTALLSASAVLLATASARSAVELNKACQESDTKAKIVNRCSYPVYIWSVFKDEIGCPSDKAVVLKTGETYQEKLQDDLHKTGVGVSIKVSKSDYCTRGSIAQLEYYLSPDKAYPQNFLDVSYVDCQNNDCPTRQEGYYLNVNNGTDVSSANTGHVDMAICPTLSCSNQDECSKMSYVLPDDPQTKSCNQKTDMVWYMCGGEAPGSEDYTAPSPSSEEYKEETPAPTSTKEAANYQVAAAAAEVTPAPVEEPKPSKKIRTEVVVVTKYINAKRHAHRHQHFHA